MAPFRDSNRIQALRDRVRLLEGQLDLAVLRRISSDAADLVGSTRAETARFDEAGASAMALDHALDAYAAALESGMLLIDRASAMPRKAPYLVLDAPALIPPGVADTSLLDFEANCAALREVATTMDYRADTRMLSDRTVVGLRIRFMAGDAPIELLYQGQEVAGLRDEDRPLSDLSTKLTIATGVPLVTPTLRLKPERFRHALLKAVSRRLVPEVQIGDREFDQLFLIYATPRAATSLLTSTVRKTLLVVARLVVPELVVDDGNALLIWSSPRGVFQAGVSYPRRTQHKTISAAIRALAELRAASAVDTGPKGLSSMS